MARCRAANNQLARETEETWARAVAAYRANALQEALRHAVALVTRANQYIDQTSPFKIAKDPARAGDLDDILHTLAEVCRALGILLWPVMPGAAEKLQRQLGFDFVNTILSRRPEPIAENHPMARCSRCFRARRRRGWRAGGAALTPGETARNWVFKYVAESQWVDPLVSVCGSRCVSALVVVSGGGVSDQLPRT